MKNDFFKYILLSSGSKQNRTELETEILPYAFNSNGHRLRNYRIYGNTIERKNLLKNTAVSQTVNGVTFTVNEDGSVTANGTATATTNFYLNQNLTIPRGDYIVSLTTVGSYSNSSKPLIILQNFGNYTYTAVNTTKQLIVTSNLGSATIQIPQALEVDCTFYPMIRRADIEDSTYEPYIENTSVGDLQANGKYLVPVTVCGKNLLKNTAVSQTVNGVTFTVNEDGSVTANGTATATTNFYLNQNLTIPRGDYIVSLTTVGSYSNSSKPLIILQNFGNYTYTAVNTTKQLIVTSNLGSATIQIPQALEVDCTFYPMIRRADIEDSTYEPYHETQTVSIELDEPLGKIGDEADYIDFREQKQYFAVGTSKNVSLPAIPTIDGTNIITVDTETQPSKIYIQGNIEEIETVLAETQALQTNMQSLQPLSLDENAELDVMPSDKNEFQTNDISEMPVEDENSIEEILETENLETTGDDENAE